MEFLGEQLLKRLSTDISKVKNAGTTNNSIRALESREGYVLNSKHASMILWVVLNIAFIGLIVFTLLKEQKVDWILVVWFFVTLNFVTEEYVRSRRERVAQRIFPWYSWIFSCVKYLSIFYLTFMKHGDLYHPIVLIVLTLLMCTDMIMKARYIRDLRNDG